MSKRLILGPAVKAIREAKKQIDPKFAGSQFAIRCNMSHAHLSNIEAGRKYPPADVVHLIAKQLGEPVDAISYVIDDGLEATA